MDSPAPLALRTSPRWHGITEQTSEQRDIVCIACGNIKKLNTINQNAYITSKAVQYRQDVPLNLLVKTIKIFICQILTLSARGGKPQNRQILVF